MKSSLFLTSALALLLPCSVALSASGHDAHVHGHATLNIIIEGNAIYMDLESPAANIVGFEHEVHDEQQRKLIADAVERLEMASGMFDFGLAQCMIKSVEVDSELMEEDDHGRGHNHGHEGAAGHSEFEVEYQFQCQAMGQLSYIDVNAFDLFPGIEELEVTLLKGGQQLAMELNAKQRRIQW